MLTLANRLLACAQGFGFSVTLTDTWSDATGTATFSAASIGPASSDRIVVVCLATVHSGIGDPSLTALTIGGVSATIVQGGYNTGGDPGAWIAYAAVPTGTTANIVPTYGAAMRSQAFFVYSVTGISSFSVKSSGKIGQTTAVTSTSISPTVGSGDFCLGVVSVESVGATETLAWDAPSSEDAEINFIDTSYRLCSTARLSGTASLRAVWTTASTNYLTYMVFGET